MYEHSTEPLMHWRGFVRRALRHAAAGIALVVGADAIGTMGYRVLAGLPWIDAFLNASMILAGMGPVDRLSSPAAKLFAAVYALFSGLVFIAVLAVILTPWVHRLMHKVHVGAR